MIWNFTSGWMKTSAKAMMKANQKNAFKLILISLLIQTVLMNTSSANDDEIDADFLEFLAEMEEATGSGFDSWLNDDDIEKNEEIESTELQK